MKRYTVGAVRQRLAEALDEALQGVPVIIERKGVRYRLSVDRGKPVAKAKRARIEILDPAVADGRWSWEWTPEGLGFRGRRT